MLAEAVRGEGGPLADALRPDPGPPGNGYGEALAGPRTAARAEEYEVVLEAVREGYELHYGAPRAVRPPDADMALLGGDRLYALGLARLVALGDIAAVYELADVIGLSAMARAAHDPDLAEAVWGAGVKAIGWGSGEAHRRAKALAGTGAPEAHAALLDAAS